MSDKEQSQDLILADNTQALVTAEIDKQIATAKAYPRNLRACIKEAMDTVSLTKEIAAGCIYSLPRDGKTITGASIRLAEIMVSAWTNIHCATRLVKNDGKFVSVEALVIDREKNVIYSETVERSIMTSAKKGTPRTYSIDMQQTTMAAASSIALRRAIFRHVKPFVNIVFEQAKKALAGEVKNAQSVKATVAELNKLGIENKTILNFFEIETFSEMNEEQYVDLVGLKNSIKEGMLKPENAFDKSFNADTGEVQDKAKELNDNLLGAGQQEPEPQE